MTIPYGATERDLTRLVCQRVMESVKSVLQLTDDNGQAYLVALAAVNTAVGMWSATFAARNGVEIRDPAAALEALAAVMREVDGSAQP